MSESGEVEETSQASIVDALLVYAEPLASNAYTVVIGDAASSVAERLLDLGSRSVTVFDPDPVRASMAARTSPRGVTVRSLVDDLDVRDGTFDLAIIPDLSELNDPRGVVERLRRAIANNGSLVAMSRARGEGGPQPFGGKLGPPSLAYADLYDLFASQFDDVTLAGVIPFTGVVFAELGSDNEDPAVSVDTRLVPPDAPSVFVIVASQEHARGQDLDPYAIIQVDEPGTTVDRESQLALEAVVAAAQLKAELLGAQVEELRDRLVVADVRAVEMAGRLERAGLERDGALTRAMEIEAVLAASQQAFATLERRLLEAERGMLDRDDRIATLSAELDTRASARPDLNELLVRAERAEAALAIAQEELSARHAQLPSQVEVMIEDVAELVARAERAESELAAHAESHGAETAAYESQLRDRARLIASLEKELIRREHLVKELVASVEEQESVPRVYEASAPIVMQGRGPEVAALERKLEELAGEIARREGELTARGWRIQELENQLSTAPAVIAPEALTTRGEVIAPPTRTVGPNLEDELDALRRALAQEHKARLSAESGEELSKARAELAQKAALLEQIRAQRESS